MHAKLARIGRLEPKACRRSGWWIVVLGIVVASPSTSRGDDLAEVSNDAARPASAKPHPIDPALNVARDGLKHIRTDVADYTATIVKRERVNDTLGETQYMLAKIRTRQTDSDGKVTTPFSVYLKFLQPKSVKGREVIWVEGGNGGKLVAHEAGFLNIRPVYLDPNGYLAMLGQRYPITKIGIENLVAELIEKGETQRKFGECEVKFFKNTRVDGRVCTMIEVIHPKPRDHFDFHRARIFIDDELNVPIRYAAWSWPEEPGGEPVLLEEYTYVKLKLNVGLTDDDFDIENPDYDF